MPGTPTQPIQLVTRSLVFIQHNLTLPLPLQSVFKSVNTFLDTLTSASSHIMVFFKSQEFRKEIEVIGSERYGLTLLQSVSASEGAIAQWENVCVAPTRHRLQPPVPPSEKERNKINLIGISYYTAELDGAFT